MLHGKNKTWLVGLVLKIGKVELDWISIWKRLCASGRAERVTNVSAKSDVGSSNSAGTLRFTRRPMERMAKVMVECSRRMAQCNTVPGVLPHHRVTIGRQWRAS
jgi:hypothetical protein